MTMNIAGMFGIYLMKCQLFIRNYCQI